MEAHATHLPGEPIPPRSPLAVRRRAVWHLLIGLGGGMLPLLLAILFFSIGWITYNFLGGQCAACDNGHGLPLFYAVTGLLGVACLAAPVCLLVKRARFIGRD